MANRKSKKIGGQKIGQGFFLGDTSGRTRELNEKSTFAICSLKGNCSVKMLSKDKKSVFRKLKKKSDLSDEKIFILMHSVKIYYAINGFLDFSPGFYICSDGFNPRLLASEVRGRFDQRYISKKFIFESSLKQMFGKHNMADVLAGDVNSGKKKCNILLEEKHFRKLRLL